MKNGKKRKGKRKNGLVIGEIIKRQVRKKPAQLSFRVLDFVCTLETGREGERRGKKRKGRLPLRFRRVISLISQYAAGSNSRSRCCRHFRVSPIISSFLRNLISNVRCAICDFWAEHCRAARPSRIPTRNPRFERETIILSYHEYRPSWHW